jgi:hypothetical protein
VGVAIRELLMFSSVTEVSPMTALRQRMLEDLRIRNYAPTTVACYIRSVAEFARHFNKPPDRLGSEEIRSWQLFLLNEKRVKLTTYIQAVCALRFFYQNTLHRRIEIDSVSWRCCIRGGRISTCILICIASFPAAGLARTGIVGLDARRSRSFSPCQCCAAASEGCF